MILFDLGLSRTTTKFVAECLGRGEEQKFPSLFWTSFWSQVLIGVVLALPAAAAVPRLVDRYLKLSPAYASETKLCFLILAVSFPVVLGGNSIRGVLEAVQRFDVVNYVRIPTYIGMFLLPAIGLPFGSWPSRHCASFGAFAVGCGAGLPRRMLEYVSLDPQELCLGLQTVAAIAELWRLVIGFESFGFLIGLCGSLRGIGSWHVLCELLHRSPGSGLGTARCCRELWLPPFSRLSLHWMLAAHASEYGGVRTAIKSLLLIMTPVLLVIFVFAPQVAAALAGSRFRCARRVEYCEFLRADPQ